MTAELPGIAEHVAAERAEERKRQWADIERRHMESIRLCWPEWDGPKVGARCQVHQPVAFNITHGQKMYHAGAPCVLEAQDGDYWIARIEYAEGSQCAKLYNGQRLRLGIYDIWPPVYELREAREAV
jgi:hypothetical protein